MKNLIKAIIVAAVALPGVASATAVSDHVYPNVWMTEGRTAYVYHDLRSYGVPTVAQVVSASLRLTFSDGARGDFALDVARVNAGGTTATWEVDGTNYFLDARWVGLNGSALDDLNADGLLRVSVRAQYTGFGQGYNDFRWYSSSLYANLEAVPAPAVLTLMGLGLLGMGFVRRKA